MGKALPALAGFDASWVRYDRKTKEEPDILNRSLINRIRFLLEDVLPPVARDSRFFFLLMRLVYGKNAKHFTDFRPALRRLTIQEYGEYYRKYPALLRDTDLNQTCIDRILSSLSGSTFIDIGCGRGILANLLAEKTVKPVVGYDLIIEKELSRRFPKQIFLSGAVERLPFKDHSFDTVVCAHTLEHIGNLERAVSELRRIARTKLILVVPREREYRYSFNLHVHFFPYPHSFLNRIGPPAGLHSCEVLDGDIYYEELRDDFGVNPSRQSTLAAR